MLRTTRCPSACPAAHSLWPDTDLVIGLGTRLQSQVMSWGRMGDEIIHVDIDETQIGRSAPVDIGIHARLADAVPRLLSAIDGRLTPTRTGQTALQMSNPGARPNTGSDWVRSLNGLAQSTLPHDGIFVDELTQTGYVSRFAFPSYGPSVSFRPLSGHAWIWLATALGAHARRDVPVVSISGDGGALFTITELATAVHHNIPLTTVIFNDHAFGNVGRLQMDNTTRA